MIGRLIVTRSRCGAEGNEVSLALRSSVSRSSRWRGTRHSLESGMRGMRSVLASSMSLTIVLVLVNVTTWPTETMS